MSAFLGPIHFWMYDKILISQDLCFKIEEKFLEKFNKEELDMFQVVSKGNLEELIELDNIHGWLQSSVSKVEIRFAYVVKTLLDLGISIKELQNIAFEFGESLPRYEINSTKDSYELLMDILLDGLPCDVSISIVKEEENSLEFVLYNDIHKQYFEEFDMNVSIYHDIRKSFVNGILNKYSFKYENLAENKKLIERF